MSINIQTEKQCSICGKIKPLTEFYSQKKHSKKRGDWVYYNPECKECTQKRSYIWQIDHPSITYKMKRKYELSPRNKKLKKKRNVKTRLEGKQKEWRQKHPEKIKEYNQKTRLHKKHEISKDELKALYQYANYSCMYCGISEKEAKIKYHNKLHKDHAINTGSNKIDNCILACKSCNANKHTMDWDKWYITTDFYTEERYLHILNWLTNWKDIINQYTNNKE